MTDYWLYAMDCLHIARSSGAVTAPSRKRCARCRAQRTVILVWVVSDDHPVLEFLTTAAQQGVLDERK